MIFQVSSSEVSSDFESKHKEVGKIQRSWQTQRSRQIQQRQQCQLSLLEVARHDFTLHNFFVESMSMLFVCDGKKLPSFLQEVSDPKKKGEREKEKKTMKQTPFTLSNGVCLLPTAVGMKVKAREWREGVRLKTSLNERRIEGKTQETESVTCNFPLRWDCCCRNFSWSRRSDCGITSLTLSSSVKIKVLILAGDSKYEYITHYTDWLFFEDALEQDDLGEGLKKLTARFTQKN